MKNNPLTSNLTIILLGVLLVVTLFVTGYKSDKKDVELSDPHSKFNSTDVEIEDEVTSNLDEEVDFALANIEKGKSSGDMSLVMNEGIMKLLAVTKKDSNNIRAIYYLGLFSLESRQLQKAEKRFEKLVSLQPQNEEYVNTLQKIRNQIGK